MGRLLARFSEGEMKGWREDEESSGGGRQLDMYVSAGWDPAAGPGRRYHQTDEENVDHNLPP